MSDNTYYLNINSVNLAHYINSGIIFSARLYDNRPIDIQSSVSDSLLLSSIEIYLNDSDMMIAVKNIDETKLSNISDTFFLYNHPICLSSITKIITKRNIKDLISTIAIGNVGFVEETLFEDSRSNQKEIDPNVKHDYQYDEYVF